MAISLLIVFNIAFLLSISKRSLRSQKIQLNYKDMSQQEIHQQEQQQDIVFGDRPIQMKCPFCLQKISTQIILKPQYTTFVLSLFLFMMLPHILGLVAILFIFQLTSVNKHRCPMCERELGGDGKFLYYFRDQVYSFNLGGSGVIMSKKIIVSILMTILAIMLLRYKATRKHDKYFVDFVDTPWTSYLSKCSLNQLKEDHILKECRFMYEGKTFQNWTGYIMRIQDNRASLRKYYDHAVRLYVKMDPQQVQNKPEAILSLDSYIANEFDAELDSMHHGDQIMFNATIWGIKDRALRHMHLIDVVRTGKSKPETTYYLRDHEMEEFNKLRVD